MLVGIGSFGGQIAAARWFAQRGARLVITDRKQAHSLAHARAALSDLDVAWRLGSHDDLPWEQITRVCLSPAIPRSAPVWREVQRRGIAWTTEMNLALSLLPVRPVCVTGSNGKTTTAHWIAALLQVAQPQGHVVLAGNMGWPLLAETETITQRSRVVLELSSFQLQDAREAGAPLRPALAVVTHIAPNHLDRHGDFASYVREKRFLVERLEEDATAVLPHDDPVAAGFAAVCRGRVVRFGLADPGCAEASFVHDGALCWRRADGQLERIAPVGALRLRGSHNVRNALAVCAAGCALGLPRAAVRAALTAFEPLPDRLEPVGAARGITFVNDTKATTAEAAAAALEAYAGRALLLCGGVSKATSFETLAAAAQRHRARGVFAYGASAAEIVAAVARREARLRCEQLPDLAAAFAAAVGAARAGDVVLLSPACASYDQYASYRERGAHFRELVAQWISARSPRRAHAGAPAAPGARADRP